MTQIEKLSLIVVMTMGSYCLLTIPHLLALFTIDFETGHYYGFVYPSWLVLLCSLISIVTGNLIARYFLDIIEKNNKIKHNGKSNN